MKLILQIFVNVSPVVVFLSSAPVVAISKLRAPRLRKEFTTSTTPHRSDLSQQCHVASFATV
jgi:hypothetical protein